LMFFSRVSRCSDSVAASCLENLGILDTSGHGAFRHYSIIERLKVQQLWWKPSLEMQSDNRSGKDSKLSQRCVEGPPAGLYPQTSTSSALPKAGSCRVSNATKRK
jgi:hypothetical protein